MNDDAVLLRRYVEGSETAFTELVRRHVDLVYGAALRRTGGDSHLAADVAQQVFTALARNARKLSRHAVLGAWLHTATRNAALNLMISEQRRRVRESEALALDPAGAITDASPDWDRLRPVLDTAIDELPERDRAAVVLRFLERRAFAEVGAALHVSEDAARMRTERALDKLRAALARQGITSTAAALGAIVSGHSAISAPAGLAAALSSHSLAVAGTGVVVTTLVSFMTAKIITTAGVSALLAFVTGAYFGVSRNAGVPLPPVPEPSVQAQTIASLRHDNQRLQAEVTGLKSDIGWLKEKNAAPAAQRPAPPLPAPARKSVTLGMSRGELQQAVLTNLQQIASARDQFQSKHGRPPSSVEELVGRGRYIKHLRTVNGEDYSELSMFSGQVLTVTAPDGVTVTYDPSGANTTRPELPPEAMRVQELGRRIQAPVNKALVAYRAANQGKDPPNEQALLPFFATAQEGADFVEFIEAQKAAER